jgi:hypothetical protein
VAGEVLTAAVGAAVEAGVVATLAAFAVATAWRALATADSAPALPLAVVLPDPGLSATSHSAKNATTATSRPISGRYTWSITLIFGTLLGEHEREFVGVDAARPPWRGSG